MKNNVIDLETIQQRRDMITDSDPVDCDCEICQDSIYTLADCGLDDTDCDCPVCRTCTETVAQCMPENEDND